MPTYEYAPSSGRCRQCNGVFTVVQRIADRKLTRCPTCKKPCERRISAVASIGPSLTSDAAVKRSGFTKYRNTGDGVYERTAGTGGPEHLFKD